MPDSAFDQTSEALLSKNHTILDRPFMQFIPFGVDERGKQIEDISGMIVRDNVEYLEEWIRRTRGADAAKETIDELCRLLNGRIRDWAYHVTPEQLMNAWNSYSYEFTSYLREFCRQLFDDPAFHMNVGRHKHISPLIQTLGRPFSLAQIHRMYPYFAKKFAKGLEYTVIDVTPSSAVLRLTFPEQVYRQFGPYRKACVAQICESAKGRISVVPPRLHALPASRVSDRACVVNGDDYCEWEVQWQREPQQEPAWMWWGGAAGIVAFSGARLLYPVLSLGESLLAGLLPILVSGFLVNRRLQRQNQQRDALIQEQVNAVELRHEELRDAYLEQEQTRVELRRKVNHLTVLHRAGLLFGSTLDREALLQQVLETLTRDLHYDRAMISFFDSERRMVHGARVWGVSPEMQAFAQSREFSVSDPESPEGTVLLQGKPLLIGDVRTILDRLHPLNRQLATATGAKSLLIVPLKIKDRVFGTLVVDRMQEHSLTEEDLELMMTVAHQVASALDNASAYQQIEELNVGLEAKVRERTAELEQADRLRSEFLSHVSHELKTPLTSIKGFLQNLLDGLTGPLNEKQRSYLTRMLDNSERLIRMIEDLLDRTRIQSGRLDLTPTEVDLILCVTDAIEQMRPLAQAKRQTLEVIFPPADLWVWADRDRIFQVVTNLVQNAVKFTPEGGAVMVTVGRDGHKLAGISVRDTGPGIPPELAEKVFDPFFRIKQARTGAKGLGLGLSIVRTLVELHGGTIVIRDVQGQGADFYVTVPLLPVAEFPGKVLSPEAARILVVDDDSDIRQLLLDRMRAEGYRVYAESDGARALEAVRTQSYSGLILDLGLPSMDGMEVLKQIRKWDQQIPIVVLTASGAKERAVRAISIGAQAYLLKPFDVEELQHIAGRWFGSVEPASITPR